MLPFQIIVCPTDFDEPSDYALQAAMELAQHFGAQLCLVHIIPDPPPLSYYPHPSVGLLMPPTNATSPLAIEHSLCEQIQKHLMNMAKRKVPPAVLVRCVVHCGNPADEILKLVSEEKGVLLVLGTHARTGWGRLFHGSLAEAEVRHAPCPVLVVHNTHGESENSGEVDTRSTRIASTSAR